MNYLTDKYQLRIDVLTRMLEISKNNQTAIKNGTCFFGDSITQLCNLNKFYPNIHPKYNCGVAGITSKLLLYFIDEGLIKYHPKQVVIMIGTNDLGNTVMASPRQIALNVQEMIDIIHQNLPECKIILCSCIPCLKNHTYQETNQGIRSNDTIQMIYKEYQKLFKQDYIKLLNIYDCLLTEGKPDKKYYVDGLHINDDGYQLITNLIKQNLE